jgi:hypothetical protein
MKYKSENFGLIKSISKSKLIKIYRSLYFNIIQLLVEENEEIERGSYIKKEGIGIDRRIVSKKGFYKSEEIKELIFRWFNLYEGGVVLGNGIDYIFFDDLIFGNLIDFVNKKNIDGKVEDRFRFYYLILKNRKGKLFRLFKEESLKTKYWIDIGYNKNTKKYSVNVIDDSKFKNLEVILEEDIDYTVEDIKYFKECRNDILEKCDEWYDISSNWVNNKKKYKDLKETDFDNYMRILLGWFYEYDEESNTLRENYNEFRKKVYSGYCELNDLNKLKDFKNENYTTIQLIEYLKELRMIEEMKYDGR